MRCSAAVVALSAIATVGCDQHKETALQTCSSQITPRLTSPGSARFGQMGEPGVSVRTAKNEVTGGDGATTVVGWVDSQNLYGAMLRTIYRCRMFRSADGKFTVYEFDAEPFGTDAADQLALDSVTRADTAITASPPPVSGDRP